MKRYDLHFIGQICQDEVIHDDGSKTGNCGGAALYGVVAASVFGAKVAAHLKLSAADRGLLEPFRRPGVEIFPIEAPETTAVEIIHRGGNVDSRSIVTKKFSGIFKESEVPVLDAAHIHLAGCNDHEFPLAFIRAVKARKSTLSIDMQCFVRFNDPATGEMSFRDDPQKMEVIPLMDRIKLDVTEARLLTGTEDLSAAAAIIERWGCPEVMITKTEGVLVRCRGREIFEPFSNRSVAGRTGRGDTTFGAYLGARVTRSPEDALKYAAALVSIKMESPGPFQGNFADVEARAAQSHGRKVT